LCVLLAKILAQQATKWDSQLFFLCMFCFFESAGLDLFWEQQHLKILKKIHMSIASGAKIAA